MAQSQPTHWQLLQILQAHPGAYCAGPALAAQLHITRTGVWKHIRKLRAAGYTIETHPKAGYQLVTIPDLLLPEAIVPQLQTVWCGKNYIHLSEVDSTNDYALRLAAQGAPHGTVVVAEQQTRGRGRLQRPWLSPPRRGIYLSLLLTTPMPPQQAPQSAQVAALALVKVLHHHYGLPAVIKWPNDILIRHRKAAGILAEMQTDQDLTRFLILGIGINVNHQPNELQGPFRYPATSLAMEMQAPLARQQLLVQFLRQFEADYQRFVDGGFAAVGAELEAASAILGKTVTIHCDKEDLSGKALGFTAQGALRLLTGDGREQIIWVGDVTRVEGDF